MRNVRTRSSTDTTEKFLFELHDHSLIETVLIPATPGLTTSSDRHTVCVSTQVGCAYGCKFCASGLDGVKRNLTAAEIVDQVVASSRGLTDQRVTNLVIMGMGEPLANYDNLMRALRILNAPWALGIGARKITVSTVGLVPRIKQLADDPMQIRLAVSLHGATDEVRERIMPVNKKYPLKELLAACDYYVNTKQRMMTFEYILIDGVNDTLEQAHKLGAHRETAAREGQSHPVQSRRRPAVDDAPTATAARCSSTRSSRTASPPRCASKKAPTSTPPAASCGCSTRRI